MDEDAILYAAFLQMWLKSKRYSIAPQTITAYESHARTQVIPLLGNYKLVELKPMVLQDFVATLMDSGLANGSVRRIFSVVSSSLDAAVRMEFISKNPASLVNLPKVKHRQLQVWDMNQVRSFLELAAREPYTYVAFHLALLTGMRQGEILGLRWMDVNFDSRNLSIRQTLSHDGQRILPGAKTGSSVRSVALDPTTVDVLQRHRGLVIAQKDRRGESLEPDELVLQNPNSKQKLIAASLMRSWNKLLKESGLPKITFHDLRHTHASMLLKNNVHPKIVSERLGHASIQITLDTYSHLLPNMQKEAAGTLGQALFGESEGGNRGS